MAAIVLEPTGTNFPGGIAGGFGGPATSLDSTTRWTAQPPFPLGTRAKDFSGNKWILVKSGAAIAANDPVVFQGSALGYDDVRSASAAQQLVIGVATAAFTGAAVWGFIQTHGVVVCKVVVATAAGSLLVTGAVAAQLELADATDFAGARPAVALVTGVAAGSAIYLGP